LEEKMTLKHERHIERHNERHATRLEKQVQKREWLTSGAFRLFKDKGFTETSIDDIVKESGVAKGTFYLYFKNKTELLTEVVTAKSREILGEAYAIVSKKIPTPSVEALLEFIECLIDKLSRDTSLLELIYKNLSWGFYKKMVSESDHDETIRTLKESFLACIKNPKQNGRDPDKILFVIIELTSSICYSAIIRNEPAPMKEMKPILLDSVRRIVAD
jgi:AcrR family transcriptional regulator